MSKFAIDKVAERFSGAVIERYEDRSGAPWAVIAKEQIRDVAQFLKTDHELQFRLFLSADAVDRMYLPVNDPRFEVVYFLRSLLRNEVINLKVRVGGETPEVPSVTPVFQGANWWERFVWDFYGIKFEGHPDLRRILMYEDFKGHPLRKDYPLRQRQPLIPERPIQDLYRGPGTSGV